MNNLYIDRDCLLCGAMICGCAHCTKTDSLQGRFGICDTDLWDVFPSIRGGMTREVKGSVSTLSWADPRVQYLSSLLYERRT